MFPDDLRAHLEKFLGNRRQLFDPQFLSESRVAAAVGEEHGDFRETARLPVHVSPVTKIGVG